MIIWKYSCYEKNIRYEGGWVWYRHGIRAQSTVSYRHERPRVGTGDAEVERSIGKGFVKNLNLSWVFEVCRNIESSQAKNKLGPIVGHFERLANEAYFNIEDTGSHWELWVGKSRDSAGWNGFERPASWRKLSCGTQHIRAHLHADPSVAARFPLFLELLTSQDCISPSCYQCLSLVAQMVAKQMQRLTIQPRINEVLT